MESQIDHYRNLPKRYWILDGTAEIALGLQLGLFGLYAILAARSPKGSVWDPSWLLLAGLVLTGSAVQAFKRRVTGPRTGFIQPKVRRKSMAVAAALAGALVVLALWALPHFGHFNGAVLFGLVAIPGYAFCVARWVHWKWWVVGVLAAGILAICCIPPELVNAWLPWVSQKAYLPHSPGGSLRIAILYAALVTIASGAISLRGYLRQYPPVLETTE